MESYFQKTGRRKTAVAQVRLVAGGSTVMINDILLEERCPRLLHRQTILRPLTLTGTLGKYSVLVKVAGGGISGQSDAIAHGIARALMEAEENLKPILRQNGLLTRDSRSKERKKVGLKRARKAPQSPKR